MNNKTTKTLFLLTLAFLAGMWAMHILKSQKEVHLQNTPTEISSNTNLETQTTDQNSNTPIYSDSNKKKDKKKNTSSYQNDSNQGQDEIENKDDSESMVGSNSSDPIEELTNEKVVVAYLKQHQKLPPCYISKSEAKNRGWIQSEGNLCKVLPGRAIGGDIFTNREGTLPKKKGRKYYEADINYDCGRRDAQRLVYSNDGLIFITKDHYKSFQEL